MMKWIKRVALGVVSLIVLVLAVVYGVSETQMRKKYDVQGQALAITADPAQIERGRHVATAVAKCADCHGEDLGGKVFIDGGPVMGTLVASNLTAGRGGVLGKYTDAQLEAAIRHGIGPDRKPLLFMPSQEFQYLSDQDVAATIAYIRSLPRVDRELGGSSVGPMARALMITGAMPLLPARMIDHDAPQRPVPPAGPTREYGQYLVSVGGCTGCHGPDLGGATMGPGSPRTPNLTPAGSLASWSEADFFKAMRTGVRPDGKQIADEMPWRAVGKGTDEELRAIYLYLRSVPRVVHPAE